MPTIREYGPSGTSSIVPTANRASSFASSTFGVAEIDPGSTGRSVRNIASSIRNFTNRLDTNSAEEASIGFERDKNTLFFNPDSGYMNSQGKNAYDAADDTREELDKLRRSYAEGLKSGNARNMFNRATESQITRGNQDISRHASSQFQAWESSTINAQVENTLENASLYWNDPVRMGVQRDIGIQSVLDAASIKGDMIINEKGAAVYGEATLEAIETYNSTFSVAMIEAALVQSAAAAETTLTAHKDTLEGPALVDLERKIANKKLIEKDQVDSAQAVLTATDYVNDYGDFDNARSTINKRVSDIEDPELRKKTMREVDYQLGAKQKADNEYRAQVYDSGLKYVQGGGSVDQIIARSPNDWEKLTASQQNTIRNGVTPTTNYETFSDLMLLPDRELANTDPNDYVDQLSPGDFGKLITAVNSAKESGGEHQVGRTRTAEVTDTVNRIFGVSSKRSKNEDLSNQTNAFYAMITAEQEFRESQKDGELTSEEFTAMLGDMTRKLVVNRSVFIPGSTEFDLTDVPAENVNQLTNFLHENNIPVTSENLVKAYQQASQ